jgi:tetratricopeptide (TPR) repeat protein
VERATALVADAGPTYSKASVLETVSRFLMVAGEVGKAIPVGREALAMAETLGLEDLRAAALNTIGTARSEAGDWDGLEDIERSIEMATAINSPEAWRALVNLASAFGFLGDLKRSFEILAEADRVADRFGYSRDLRWMRAERVAITYFTGRWDESIRLADEFIANVEAGSPHYMESVCREYRGRIRVARGDVVALEDADRELELARVAKDPQVVYPALSFRALALLAAGRREEAADHAAELLSLWREKPLVVGLAWPIDLAFVLDELVGPELLAASAKSPESRWIEAATAFVSGELERAATMLAEIGSLPDEAKVRLRSAEERFAAGRRREADAELQRALAFFRSVEASAYVRHAETLLATSA